MSGAFQTPPQGTRRWFDISIRAEDRLAPSFDPEALSRFEAALSFPRRRKAVSRPATEPLTASQALVQRIRAEREHRGWTQKQLAERTGMKRENVVRLEAGRHAPTVDTVELVANALGLSVGELFETAVAASELRNRNDRLVKAGAVSLRAALQAMREKGIIDAKGRRISKELPKEMREGTSEAV